MSSKKVASKDSKSKKAPAKAAAKSAAKPAAKAAAKAPAKKPAEKPAKKVAPAAKKPAPAPAKKAPAKAKPAPKAESKKSVTKDAPKTSTAKKALAAKSVATEKKVSKSSAKPVAAKTVEKVATKPNAAEKVEKATPAAKKSAPAPVKAPVKEEKKVAPVEAPKVKEEPAAVASAAADDKGEVKKKNAPDYAYAVLLQGVKRLSKTIMFVKVDESEDRSNKKKMSSDVKNLDMKPTSPIRHKASLAEETQEELTERILKELEEQNRLFEREAATQMCTRCNRNLVSPEFWVDKHLGFCEECAAILKLGQSKEARKVEYQLGAMDGDSLDEEDDDIIGPDADDLKAAEEDLAEMDD
ncbi:hypothetical protein [Fibrobacter sp. UWH4]|uniref:hypothetical protein n=1 Tax=Fibrobacter sp. UWH4 TaxID=1896210 RepID=UPI00091909D6|nr:hypothetical protein [Fibrobacter sp. UWH4]SHK83083.1 hypothetical protein SAMN05720762_103164 [Fibrobacter sp. UWH4]